MHAYEADLKCSKFDSPCNNEIASIINESDMRRSVVKKMMQLF